MELYFLNRREKNNLSITSVIISSNVGLKKAFVANQKLATNFVLMIIISIDDL